MMDETAALELVGLKAIKLSPAHDRVQSRDSRSELTEHRKILGKCIHLKKQKKSAHDLAHDQLRFHNRNNEQQDGNCRPGA
jgi:hypothetical protein